jgi:hypothetical protein
LAVFDGLTVLDQEALDASALRGLDGVGHAQDLDHAQHLAGCVAGVDGQL